MKNLTHIISCQPLPKMEEFPAEILAAREAEKTKKNKRKHREILEEEVKFFFKTDVPIGTF